MSLARFFRVCIHTCVVCVHVLCVLLRHFQQLKQNISRTLHTVVVAMATYI